ncbi:hypothetical protein AJ79_07424 [Helicocarpus griseus UAMH5409]|uniref:Methylitaconate delta2-delta3-isomerase n=1 Tax=Helicocarpus griseus UAMH5409 TaxID=1447875 RepID=A0A2B7X2X1_9EURO|nr:hypothetical protein AJ79_07424 [Helicocarpus griseus UAMH5409]
MAVEVITQTRRLKRHVLPCVLMRAGTSKGMFIHRRDLPAQQADWAPHLISALGSRCNDPRQIDGVGGGTSTTSKVAVVSVSERPDADVDFTFVQVAIGKESVDLTGTCGNMVSGVAPFAVQEGLVKPQPGQIKMDVRVYSTNTDKTVVETVEIDEATGEYEEDGDYTIPGVSTTGSEVKCAFVNPAGSMTGKLFPSGHRQQILRVPPLPLLSRPSDAVYTEPFDVRVSLVDAANPFVLIDTTSISTILKTLPSSDAQDVLVEFVRREGAVAMGLATSVEAAALVRGTPKVALLYPPFPPLFTQDGSDKTETKTSDIRVQSYSMGLPHPSLQLTGAVCLAAALSCPGTVAAQLSSTAATDNHGDEIPLTPERTPSPGETDGAKTGLEAGGEKEVVIAHSKGTMKVGVVMGRDGEAVSCAVSRTARRLFEGRVRYYV